MTAAFDLDRYLTRIGYAGPTAATRATLAGLVAAHTAAIPFENLDVPARRPIQLGIGPLQDKLVAARRGGYCFEQNALFLAALRAVGFTAAGLIAHVRLGIPPEVEMSRSHMILRVELPEGPHLADVGFGGLTPTGPLALGSNAAQATPHESYRLVAAGGETMLQARLGEDWRDVYGFDGQVQRPVDYEVANWFTSTHPSAPFLGNVIASRPVAGERRTLFNWRFVRRRIGQAPEPRILGSMAEYHQVLDTEFGLEPDSAARAAIEGVLAQRAPDAPAMGPFA
jgi:N-hydroxyarylamine O-acetyltransferase